MFLISDEDMSELIKLYDKYLRAERKDKFCILDSIISFLRERTIDILNVEELPF